MEMLDLVIMAAAVGVVAIVIRSQIEKFSLKKGDGDGENWRGNSRAGGNWRGNSGGGGSNSNLDGAAGANSGGGANSGANSSASAGAKNGANPATRDYAGFCAAIDAELDALREVCAGEPVKLAKLAAFSKELVFIQTMGREVKDARWEEKLFGFLSRVDDFVLAELPPARAQDYLDEMKARLAAAYRAA